MLKQTLPFNYIIGWTKAAVRLNSMLELSEGSSLILQKKPALHGKTSNSERLWSQSSDHHGSLAHSLLPTGTLNKVSHENSSIKIFKWVTDVLSHSHTPTLTVLSPDWTKPIGKHHWTQEAKEKAPKQAQDRTQLFSGKKCYRSIPHELNPLPECEYDKHTAPWWPARTDTHASSNARNSSLRNWKISMQLATRSLFKIYHHFLDWR